MNWKLLRLEVEIGKGLCLSLWFVESAPVGWHMKLVDQGTRVVSDGPFDANASSEQAKQWALETAATWCAAEADRLFAATQNAGALIDACDETPAACRLEYLQAQLNENAQLLGDPEE